MKSMDGAPLDAADVLRRIDDIKKRFKGGATSFTLSDVDALLADLEDERSYSRHAEKYITKLILDWGTADNEIDDLKYELGQLKGESGKKRKLYQHK